MRRFLEEFLLVAVSAVICMAGVGTLVQREIITAPAVAYSLMFLIYSVSYYLLKRNLLKRPIHVSVAEFIGVLVLLTAYMVLLLPVMDDCPGYIQLPASYWTFIFISVYISMRRKPTKSV